MSDIVGFLQATNPKLATELTLERLAMGREIVEARAALAEAVELLSRCAHAEGCSWDPSQWNDGPTPCDCGYDAFLKKHNTKEKP